MVNAEPDQPDPAGTPESSHGSDSEHARHTVVGTTMSAAAILALYFLVPLGASEIGTIGRLLGTVVALGLMVLAIRFTRRRATNLPLLVVLLVLVIVTFSAIISMVASSHPEQFVGIETRIDALYFTLTTMTTTGYGDIYAAGQFARALVSAMFFFDVVFLSLVAAEVSRLVGTRRDREAG